MSLRLIPALLLALLAGCVGLPAPDPQDRLIVESLGSRDWVVRENASRILDERGRASTLALEWGRTHEDPEIRWRAEALLRGIEARLEARDRARVDDITPIMEQTVRRETGWDIWIASHEAGHFSGRTRVIPLFLYEWNDRKRESDFIVWPLLGRYSRTRRMTYAYQIPLFVYYSLEVVGEESPARIVFVPVLLSGFIDSPAYRVVSLFPLLLYVNRIRRGEKHAFFWPALARFRWTEDSFEVGDIFGIFFRYRRTPRGHEIRIFRFIDIRWGQEVAPAGQ